MKKNLITVIILALCLINLVFNILLVFVFMPSASKTNKLITDIAKVLDLDLEAQKEKDGGGQVSVGDLDQYQLEQGNAINLANDGTGKVSVLQYGLTINMNKTAGDYADVSANVQASTSMIYDICRDVIGRYTYAQVTDADMQNKIKEELLAELKTTFGTEEGIYSVSFYNWVAQQQ